MISRRMQVSVHQPSRAIKHELKHVFRDLESFDDVLVVITCQHSNFDLVRFDPDVDSEKDTLLETVRLPLDRHRHELTNV